MEKENKKKDESFSFRALVLSGGCPELLHECLEPASLGAFPFQYS